MLWNKMLNLNVVFIGLPRHIIESNLESLKDKYYLGLLFIRKQSDSSKITQSHLNFILRVHSNFKRCKLL